MKFLKGLDYAEEQRDMMEKMRQKREYMMQNYKQKMAEKDSLSKMLEILKNPRQSPEDIVARTKSMKSEKKTLSSVNAVLQQDLDAQSKKVEQAHLLFEEQEAANTVLQTEIDFLKGHVTSQKISMSEFKRLKEETASFLEKCSTLANSIAGKETESKEVEEMLSLLKTTITDKVSEFNDKAKKEGLVEEQTEESNVLIECDPENLTDESWE